MATFSANDSISSSDIQTGKKNPYSAQIYSGTFIQGPIVAPIAYEPNAPATHMRARDTSLGRIVYWFASGVDGTGTQYFGPGPLTDISVVK